MARVTRSSKLNPAVDEASAPVPAPKARARKRARNRQAQLKPDTPIKSIEGSDEARVKSLKKQSIRSRDYKQKKRRETAQKLIQLAQDKGQPLSKAQELAVRGFVPYQRSQVAFTLQKLVLKQQEDIEALKREKKQAMPQENPAATTSSTGRATRQVSRGFR